MQGARGVGKSFLLKFAQKELNEDFSKSKTLAVYVTFNKAGLLQTSDANRFKHWMLAKICDRIIREARKQGLLQNQSSIFALLSSGQSDEATASQLETWKTPRRTNLLRLTPTPGLTRRPSGYPCRRKRSPSPSFLHKAGSGLVATRGLTGTRYMLNVGTRTGPESDPVSATNWLRGSISIKRMVEFGANHELYERIVRLDVERMDEERQEFIKSQLGRSVDDLDMTAFARGRLKQLGFDTGRKDPCGF